MKMHQIEYFLALCDEGNLTRAARRCGVAQSSLTTAIKDLEKILGGALYNRSSPRAGMTKLGSLLKPRFARIKLEADRAIKVAQRFAARRSLETRPHAADRAATQV